MTCGRMRCKFYSLIRYNFLNDFVYIFYFICTGNKSKCAPIASATIEFVMKLVVFACDPPRGESPDNHTSKDSSR